MNQGLEIVPVINKIDLPSARPGGSPPPGRGHPRHPRRRTPCSPRRKSGIGIDDIFAAIIKRVPAPRWADYPQHRALVFDSSFDSYKGVVMLRPRLLRAPPRPARRSS
jgi:GTP-binding protein LepA